MAPTISLSHGFDSCFSSRLFLATELLFVLLSDLWSVVSCPLGPDEDCVALLHHCGAAGVRLQHAGHHHRQHPHQGRALL